MSKSILQEVATLNALKFNEAKLKSNIQGLTNDVAAYYEQSDELNYKLENDYKIIVTKLLEVTHNSNELLRADMLQLDINVGALKNLTIDELSKNYFALGQLRKEVRRADQIIDDKITNLHLKKLDYFTGPIKTPIYSEGLFTGTYSPVIDPINRNWLYFQTLSLWYKDQTILNMNEDTHDLTIGDATRFNRSYFPGRVTVQTDFTINNGVATINSPNSTNNSLTTNGNIISTLGYCHVNKGFKTFAGGGFVNVGGLGNITTTSGEIRTDIGDIVAKNGNLNIETGSAFAKTGYTSTTGGFVNSGTGNISTGTGEIITSAGGLSVTDNIETTTGDIKITDVGNIWTQRGNIQALDGYATISKYLTVGNYLTVGSYLTVEGNITTNTGSLLVKKNGVTKFSVDNSGEMLVAGNAQFNNEINQILGKDTYLGRDLDVRRDAIVRRNLVVTGTTTTTGKLSVNGGIELGSALNLNGQAITNGSTAQFSGEVSAKSFRADGGSGFFYGTATSALYADVAEKYESDIDYAPGTVLSIGIDTEVTLYDPELPYAGVVSTNPGVRLNDIDNSDYIFVALTGRIPVMTNHEIKRGMYIYPDPDCPGKVIGVSKKDKCLTDEPLIGISLCSTKDGYVEVKV